MIMQEEKSTVRRDKLLNEMEQLFNNFPMGLDQKNRDLFNPKYNQLKNFIFDISI
jgi:hypothetical protein